MIPHGLASPGGSLTIFDSAEPGAFAEMSNAALAGDFMFAFLFAVVSLTNIDPEAIVTPAPLVRGTASVGSGFAPGDASLPTGLSADIDVAPACTFGMPRFGSSLWDDASSLSRTFEPQCAGSSPFGSSQFGLAGASFAYGLPWLVPNSGVVRLSEPVAARSTVNVSNTSVRFPATSAIHAFAPPLLEARPAEPGSIGARAVKSVKTARSH